MLTLLVLDALPNIPDEIQHVWVKPQLYPEDTPRISVLKSLFRDFTNAYPSLLLPVREPFLQPSIMCGGKPQRMITLYEHTCTRVCAFAACLPHNVFSVLEEALIDNVLNRNLHTAMLAIDTMSFIARYGTADLCRDHCIMIGELLVSSEITTSPECSHLIILFRRLFNFMAPEHRSDFAERFPANEHVSLWSLVPMSSFTGSIADQVVTGLVSHCLNCIREWLDKSSCTPFDVDSLKVVLACLTNIYESDNIVEAHVPESQKTEVIASIMNLWTTISLHVVVNCNLLQTLMTTVIQFTTASAKFLDNNHICFVISALWKLLNIQLKPEVKLAVLDFLSSLGTRTLPSSFEQTQTLSTITTIFSSLLQDKCVMIHQEALQTFARFAEQTSHECVVRDSLNSSSQLCDVVVQYLNQTNDGADFEQTLEEINAQANTMRTFHEADSATLHSETTWPGDAMVMGDADASEDTTVTNESNCRTILDQLKKYVEEIESERHKGDLPSWVREEVQIVQNRLSSLL